MRHDGAGVGERGEHDEGRDEGLEGGCASDVDAAEAGDHCGHAAGGVDRGVQGWVDLGEEGGEGGGVVAGERPPHAAAGGEGAD